MRYLLLLFLCNCLFVHAQQIMWTAQTDCGNYINVLKAISDKKGNCFVVGRFSGETLFRSVNSKGKSITKYGSDYSHVNFLAGYNSEGDLLFANKFSGGDYFAVRGMCTYGDGSILLFFHGTGKLTPDSLSKPANIFCIAKDGLLLWSHHLKIGSITDMVADGEGNIYISQYETNYSVQKAVKRFNKKGELTAEINFKNVIIKSLKIVNGKLFAFVESEMSHTYSQSNKEITIAIPEKHVGIAEIDCQNSVVHVLHSWEKPNADSYGSNHPVNYRHVLTSINNKMYVDILIINNVGRFNFLEEKNIGIQGNSYYYRLGEDGSTIAAKAIKAGFANTNIFEGENGNSYVIYPVYKLLTNCNNDTLPIPPHPQFIFELILCKYDRDLNCVWKKKGGGTADNYHQSFLLKAREENVYAVSDLMDYYLTDKDSLFPTRASAYYVSLIKE